MKNGMNDGQSVIELEKDRKGKCPQERAPNAAPNRLKSLRSASDGGLNNFKIMQKAKAKAGFFIFIPTEGAVGFLNGFRLDDDV